jgi:hypothetical protein
MNDHLNSIFETILPALEKAGISYWVYGGVAIAGIKGEFVRNNNKDVDVFVLNENYVRTIELVENLETSLNWEHKDARLLKGKRPKREWFLIGNRHDIFSVIPVYKVGDKVQFVYQTDLTPKSSLTQERRTINEYTFVTPSVEFIKELFMHKINGGNLTKERQRKCRMDAEVILTEDERIRLFARFDKTEN